MKIMQQELEDIVKLLQALNSITGEGRDGIGIEDIKIQDSNREVLLGFIRWHGSYYFDSAKEC